MDDYPNDGEYYDSSYYQVTEPQDQQEQRREAEAKAKANRNTIQDMIARLNDRIKFYDSLESIPDETIGDETIFRITVMANKQTVANLNIELNYWRQVLAVTK
jgi:hypothetical protein